MKEYEETEGKLLKHISYLILIGVPLVFVCAGMIAAVAAQNGREPEELFKELIDKIVKKGGLPQPPPEH